MAQKIKDLVYYMTLPYTIRLQEQSDGDWVADIPELRGCIAAGDSREEVLDLLDGAKEMWFEIRLERNEAIPEPVLVIE